MVSKSKRTYRRITCDREISKEEYEANAGQYDECAMVDTACAVPEAFDLED